MLLLGSIARNPFPIPKSDNKSGYLVDIGNLKDIHILMPYFLNCIKCWREEDIK